MLGVNVIYVVNERCLTYVIIFVAKAVSKGALKHFESNDASKFDFGDSDEEMVVPSSQKSSLSSSQGTVFGYRRTDQSDSSYSGNWHMLLMYLNYFL
jgi:hypothetical protein